MPNMNCRSRVLPSKNNLGLSYPVMLSIGSRCYGNNDKDSYTYQDPNECAIHDTYASEASSPVPVFLVNFPDVTRVSA